MRLVVGLGNPGPRYQPTRHNLGFQVVAVLSQRWGIPLQRRSLGSRWGQGRVGNQTLILAQPQTYMNRSGLAVSQLLAYFNLDASHLLVIQDDLDLPLGRLKIARKGGAGGHRGIDSIIETLGTQEFMRLKVGIGRPPPGEAVENYVLSPCSPAERECYTQMIHRAAAAAEVLLTQGVAQAMSRFHGPQPET